MEQISQLALGQHAPWFWSLVLTTSVGTAVLNQLVQAIRDYRRDRKQAAYLALRLAVQLETFADGCIEVYTDFELHRDSKGAAGALNRGLPQLDEYPNEPDAWRTLDKRLAERVLSLRGHRKDALGKLAFDSQFEAGPDDIGGLTSDESVMIGQEAWDIAASLRRKYGYGVHTSRYNKAKILSDANADLQAKQAKASSTPSLV